MLHMLFLWVFSGSAVLLETARAYGKMLSMGYQFRRCVVHDPFYDVIHDLF